MIKSSEIFLKYLSDIYKENPTLVISPSTIYNELTKFYIENGIRKKIKDLSLVGVQARFSNKYHNNKDVSTYSKNGYWIIENRNDLNDEKFYSSIKDGFKLYVLVDSSNLYSVADSLISYLLSEKIVMKCKISGKMRNDSLICYVNSKDNLNKVCQYLEKLNYNCNIKTNPFIFNNGLIGITKEKDLSYNFMISLIISRYLTTKKVWNKLNEVSVDDFLSFISVEESLLKGSHKKYYMQLYRLDNKNKYEEFLNIIVNLKRILNGTISLDNIVNYNFSKTIKSNKCYFTKTDEDKIKYVINFLEQKYGLEIAHKRIMEFIKTENYNLFTRDGIINDKGEFVCVRSVMKDNFSCEETKLIISKMGWIALLNACKYTYEKYGNEQLIAAVRNVFNTSSLENFTNDYDVRSYLGLIIPKELLKETILNKLLDNNLELTAFSLYTLILNNIENEEIIKKR